MICDFSNVSTSEMRKKVLEVKELLRYLKEANPDDERLNSAFWIASGKLLDVADYLEEVLLSEQDQDCNTDTGLPY